MTFSTELSPTRRLFVRTGNFTLSVRGPATVEIEELTQIDPYAMGLTVIEASVFEMLRGGKQNKEIASALNITARTAQFHASNLLRKIGCTSRAEIILKWPARPEGA